jgi:hypothetical protein
MTRPKRPASYQTSADVDAEIRRLEAERQRLIDAEDQRRGALIREYLSAPDGDALREALARFTSPRDGVWFGLATGMPDGATPGDRRAARRPSRATSPDRVAPSADA